jgi:hypothetical protein
MIAGLQLPGTGPGISTPPAARHAYREAERPVYMRDGGAQATASAGSARYLAPRLATQIK